MIEGACLIGTAIAVLLWRVGWQSARPPVVVGWVLALVCAMVMTATYGAWGLAMVAVAGMMTAGVLLIREALVVPAASRRQAHSAASITPPRLRLEGLARRMSVFVLVVPAGLGASLLVAFGLYVVTQSVGWLEANSLALAYVTLPTVWTILASVQMMARGPREMLLWVAAVALIGGMLTWL